MFLTLALVTALFSPAHPTVGDPVRITFDAPVTLDQTPEFEVVSRSGRTIVIRTFKPKPVNLSGTAGDVRFRNLVLPVYSVLEPGRKQYKPAPLIDPRELPRYRLPSTLIAVAALLAVAGWIAAFFLRDRKPVIVRKPVGNPVEEFRAAVVRASAAPKKWAALADATRDYLAARGIRRELTTAEVVTAIPRVVAPEDVPAVVGTVREVLQRGDLEKFSQWGPPPGDFGAVAARAMTLPAVVEPRPQPVPQQEAAA